MLFFSPSRPHFETPLGEGMFKQPPAPSSSPGRHLPFLRPILPQTIMQKTTFLLWGFLLLSGGSAGTKEQCSTGKFTANGECCRACNPGEGVAQPCGVNQTVCEPCLDSISYSDTVSATEPCKPCKECVGLESMSAPCVESDNTICKCIYGFYRDESNKCKKCRICEMGFGLVLPCVENQNTLCEKCPAGTYSDDANYVDPCFPCTVCEEDEVIEKDCAATSDAKCRATNPQFAVATKTLTDSNTSDADPDAFIDPDVVIDPDAVIDVEHGFYPGTPKSPFPITNSSEILDILETTVVSTTMTTIMGSSQPVIRSGTADNLIPVYCSILAAVVVGLVAYIAFKRWNSCKQNKQGANNRPVNQTPSPEGEKLHSDSGISVDSQSLHDQQPPTQTASLQGLKGDGNLYTSLPPNKREEVEKLLNGSTEETWRHLAGELGYKEDHIDSFTQEEYPVRALLSDWSSKDSSTMDALYSALRKIQRGDIVESLYSESTASSPV
ncbi:tumor necrosis factor receptor superfamily member 16 isoform X2 [Crotalus tigris]|uniref:tumor necrosis factor receptor superfamily member 16 isoform X2 n=1 Tax=Crotalus tigris TaxID=88082 RepID=UPI00192F1E3B|nr:tumor necrosis factor receptor superfamily member 16 isoform X2 [Crotalus tigris]